MVSGLRLGGFPIFGFRVCILRVESRGLSESGGSLWFCGGLMVGKSRRSAESLGLLDANDGVSRWHFDEHLVLLLHKEF